MTELDPVEIQRRNLWARMLLQTKPRAEIEKILAGMHPNLREDMRQRLNEQKAQLKQGAV